MALPAQYLQKNLAIVKKMMGKKLYRLADIILQINAVLSDEEWTLCSYFYTNNIIPSISVNYTGHKLKIPDHVTVKRLFEDTNTEIYVSASVVYKFRGMFNEAADSMNSWVSCLRYNRQEPDEYELFFRTPPVTEKDIFNAMCLDLIMAHHNRVILHSAYITYRGEGIVFTAPSGTGKSTQAELWANSHDDVEIINGDRSILSCDGDRPMVHGLPFCGTSGICKNVSAPLRAAVVLRQGRENRIRRLGPAEAIRLLMSECAVSPWDSDGTRNILDLLIRIVERIPVYYFSCVPDQSAVRVLEEALEGK